MAAPTVPPTHRPLLETKGTALFTTLGPAGDPQTTAVWFYLDGDDIKLSLNEVRQKARNLMRDPRVSFFMIDPTNPYRTIEARAIADWVWDDQRELAGTLGDKYGLDLRSRDEPGQRRLAVTLRPSRIIVNGPPVGED